MAIGQLIGWYVIILLVGWLTLPLTNHIFKKLSDRGYTLSRILGLLLWGFIFWLLGSLGVLQNHPGGILLALFIVAGLSFWAGWRHRSEIWAWIRQNWRLILLAEGVFLLSFVFMVFVRASNPDATGTEKPMELAFINAVINSQTFPPHDPWLSGYGISYYHFGYILAGMQAKLLGISGGVAFNLMLSSTFGMSALGAYGVLYNLLVSHHNTNRKKKPGENIFWALLGPVFLLFVSNLEAVLELLHAAGVGWNMEMGTSRFWGWVNIESLNLPPAEPLTLIPQRFWWWWQSSRVVQDIDLLGNVSGLSPIDEFPSFSYVLGDLHPHVLVMPFVMLLIGLAFAIFLGAMNDEYKIFGITLPYRLDVFIVSAVVLGGIAFLNTWDLPVYFLLLTGAYFVNRVINAGWAWKRLTEFLRLALPLGVLSILLYLPFFLSFQSQAGGILPNLVYPTRGLYLWVMFGTLFMPIILFFIYLGRDRVRAKWGLASGVVGLLILFLILISITLGFRLMQTDIGRQLVVSQGKSSYLELLSAGFVHRLGYGFSLLSLAGLLICGLAYLLGYLGESSQCERDSGPVPFAILLVLLGGLMVLTPEFVYLQDNFGTRMNTIFKFYYQAWMLWSLAAGFAAVLILKRGKWLPKVVIILFILLGLIYPILAYPSKTNGFKPLDGYSLDATAYLRKYQPNEADAIDWLSEAPYGVVAEAVGGQYTSYARVSTISGQPAVLGWPGHEGQWRGGYEEVGSREGDIRSLYSAPNWDAAFEIIQRYQIRYIYVGSLELSTYAVNLEKFDRQLQLGFEADGVRIYVVPENLMRD